MADQSGIATDLGELARVERATIDMVAKKLLKTAASKSDDFIITSGDCEYRFLRTVASNFLLFRTRVDDQQSSGWSEIARIDAPFDDSKRPLSDYLVRFIGESDAKGFRPRFLADAQQIARELDQIKSPSASATACCSNHGCGCAAPEAKPAETLREIVARSPGRTGIIVDVSSSMGKDFRERIAPELGRAGGFAAALVEGNVDGKGVLVAGKPAYVARTMTPLAWGGFTKFPTAITEAWEAMGRPDSLVVITGKEVLGGWPASFPVPTVIALTQPHTHSTPPPKHVAALMVNLQLPGLEAKGRGLAA